MPEARRPWRRKRYSWEEDDIQVTDSGYRYVQLPSRTVFMWDALDDAKKAMTPFRRHINRAFKLVHPTDMEMRTYDLERLDWFVDDIEEFARLLRADIDKLRGPDLNKRRRIELQRNNKGRTPEEAAAFAAKADQLEKEMDG
jgi:hypothetical protein